MASPSVTYTFTNGTVAYGDRVSQNFSDVINGITDGTKELSVARVSVGSSTTGTANVYAAAMDQTGSNSIVSNMTSTQANFIASQVSAAGASAIAVVMPTGGANAIASMITATGANAIAAKITTNSKIHVNTGNGHGSTNTKIRRFTTTVSSSGTDITYADSATDGASFTINRSGLYSIQYTDARLAAACSLGISKNSSQLTTSIATITAADRLGLTGGPTNIHNTLTVLAYLAAGTVIRPHTDGTPDDTTAGSVTFIIQSHL